MQPEDYLREYTAPFQPTETLTSLQPDEAALMLARSYYYPPYLKLETYLDVLSRSELLDVVQEILAIDGTKQRLTRRDVIKHLESVRRLKDELERQCQETNRLHAQLVSCAEQAMQRAIALDEQLQVTAAQLAADNAVLRDTVADMRASTSWKATAPLRQLMRAIRALRTPV